MPKRRLRRSAYHKGKGSNNSKRAKLSIVDEGETFDIISGLIDRNLENIVENILLNLDESSVANVVTANPKWAAVVTSRRRAEQYFTSDFATLEALYKRNERSNENSQRCPSAIFKQACSDVSKFDQFRRTWGQSSFKLEVKYPFDCRKLRIDNVFISDKYIAPVHSVYRGMPPLGCCKHPLNRLGHVIQLYDRWTFQLLDAISLPRDYGTLQLVFIGDSVVILCELRQRKDVFAWNQASSGKFHSLLSDCKFTGHMFSISNLIVLLAKKQKQAMVTVYKFNVNMGNSLDLLVYDEPLEMHYDMRPDRVTPKMIYGGEGLEIFGILGRTLSNDVTSYALQLRSKRDFSVRGEIVETTSVSILRYTTCLLSDGLVLFHDPGNGLEVLSIFGGTVKRVFSLMWPWLRVAKFGKLSVIGNFVVVYEASSHALGRGATVCKLPSNFVAECSRHLEEGTFGVSFELDKPVRVCSAWDKKSQLTYAHVDHYGVTEVLFKLGTNNAMRVLMTI